ncbi:MAG: hypothetical protein NC347_14975 [Clostridium sp.]|nr:hypothetical protein [Clostridium sp.]
MGKVLLLEKHRKKQQNKTDSTKPSNLHEFDGDFDAFLDYMSSEASRVLDESRIEKLIETEKEEREKFEQKYEDILSAAPISSTDRIAYYAKVMLDMLPSVFHGTWNNRFHMFRDFSEIYLTEFDACLLRISKRQ